MFVNTISALRKLSAVLTTLRLPVHQLHANMQQRQRLKHLERFRDDPRAVLVATDVAARGLDIPDVRYVVHYHLPKAPAAFVHRSGRTARGSSEGLALALVVPREQVSRGRATCTPAVVARDSHAQRRCHPRACGTARVQQDHRGSGQARRLP